MENNTLRANNRRINNNWSNSYQTWNNMQGDSFCVTLFTLSLNPIAWQSRSIQGYTFTHDKSIKIRHSLFVDDLKTYHKYNTKAATVGSTLEEMCKNTRLQWRITECTAIHIKRVKQEQNLALPLAREQRIPIPGEDHYDKFLGKFENTIQLEQEVQKLVGHEYLGSLSAIWTTLISSKKDHSHKPVCTATDLILHQDK